MSTLGIINEIQHIIDDREKNGKTYQIGLKIYSGNGESTKTLSISDKQLRIIQLLIGE